jgi:hypothetical protein
LIHGIDTPLDTPLSWLCAHFTMADLYLYICVVDTRRQRLQAMKHGARN